MRRPPHEPAGQVLPIGIFFSLAAWSIDRLGRSLQDLVAFLGDLHAQGVDLYLHIQGIDTTKPGGKALFQMMGGLVADTRYDRFL